MKNQLPSWTKAARLCILNPMQFIPSSNKKWYPSHSVVKVWWFQSPAPSSSYQSWRHPQFWYTCSVPHRLIKGIILSSSLSINSGHELLSNHSHILSKPFPVYLFLHKGQITTLSNILVQYHIKQSAGLLILSTFIQILMIY